MTCSRLSDWLRADATLSGIGQISDFEPSEPLESIHRDIGRQANLPVVECQIARNVNFAADLGAGAGMCAGIQFDPEFGAAPGVGEPDVDKAGLDPLEKLVGRSGGSLYGMIPL